MSWALEGVARELIRTTSLLERTNRELRRKFRQFCCFGSPKGAEVAIYLQVKRVNSLSTPTYFCAQIILTPLIT